MKKLPIAIIAVILMAACSSINCPLNNSVAAVWRFSPQLQGSLTVSANLNDDNDTVLINSQSSVDSLNMPLSYTAQQDSFTLTLVTTDNQTVVDHIRLSKTNQQHFESIECSPSVFHQITSAECDGTFIDSVKIINPNVTYSTVSANIIIYTSLGND